MVDLISRQEAINALFDLYEYQRDIDPTEAADLVRQGIFLAEKKIEKLQSAQPEQCDLCSNLEKGDTLYKSSDWDGGIGFDYIREIQFCPKCGRRLE